MRKQLLNTILLFIVFSFTACDGETGISSVMEQFAGSNEKEKSVKVICLIDFSESIDESIIDRYASLIKNSVINNLMFKDRILVLPIDRGSELHSEEIFMWDFSTIEYERTMDPPAQREQLKERRLNDQRESATTEFLEAIHLQKTKRSGISDNTDIFGAFNQTVKHIREPENTIIILFSDMLHHFGGFSLYNLRNSNQLQSMLDASPKVDFESVNFIVFTGDQSLMDASRFDMLRTYWQKWFEQNGANLRIYDTGSVSLLERHLNEFREEENVKETKVIDDADAEI